MTPRSKITIDEFVAREICRAKRQAELAKDINGGIEPDLSEIDIEWDIESGLPHFEKIKRRKNKPK